MNGHGVLEAQVTGTPQGGILSPLMANIALSALDEHFADAWEQMGDPRSPYFADGKLCPKPNGELRYSNTKSRTRIGRMLRIERIRQDAAFGFASPLIHTYRMVFASS